MSAMSDTQNTKVGIEPGAERMFVKSGGELDIESGGAFKIGGVAVTASAAEINAAAGTGVDSTELDLLDGALAGTVVASKAVAASADKDVADFRNLSATNLKAGKDAVAGSVTVFPATTARGTTTVTASDNAGATTTNINTAAQSGARTYTVPDAGASASFVMTEGSQTVNGVKTFGSPPVMSGASVTPGTIPTAALAENVALAALIAAGGGASIAYSKTATGTNDLLANTADARTVLIVCTVNETFADNVTGTQTVFTIGEEDGSATKFAAGSAFTNKTAGSILVFAGSLTAAKKLRVYATAAGTIGTGGITATVIAVPASA